MGIQAHLDYWTLLIHYSAYVKQHYNYFGNFSLYSFLCNARDYGWLSPNIPAFTIHICFIIVLVFLACSITGLRNRRNKSNDALEYGLWSVLLPLLPYYTEIHHFIFPIIGFLMIVGLWNEIPGISFKLLLFLGWLLICVSFHIHDLIPEVHRNFAIDYIDLLGTILTFLVMLWLLWKTKKSKDYAETN